MDKVESVVPGIGTKNMPFIFRSLRKLYKYLNHNMFTKIDWDLYRFAEPMENISYYPIFTIPSSHSHKSDSIIMERLWPIQHNNYCF